MSARSKIFIKLKKMPVQMKDMHIRSIMRLRRYNLMPRETLIQMILCMGWSTGLETLTSMRNLAALLKTSSKKPTNASRVLLRIDKRTWMPKFREVEQQLLEPRKSENFYSIYLF